MCICVCVCIHIYIYIYTYLYTHIDTYIKEPLNDKNISRLRPAAPASGSRPGSLRGTSLDPGITVVT